MISGREIKENNKKWKAYPNPTNGEVTISRSTMKIANENALIEVFGLYGTKLVSSKMDKEEISKTVSLHNL